MKYSTRILVLFVIVELLLLAGAIYMTMQITSGAWRAPDQAEALRRVYTVIGGAMGGLGGAFLFLVIALRLKGK